MERVLRIDGILLLWPFMVPSVATGAWMTIEQIQSNTVDGDASVYDRQLLNCLGGVVTSKFAGWRPRVILWDPDASDGWGAVQVKDWTVGDLFNQVQPGDWVRLANVEVEEFRGNTFLQWYSSNDPTYEITSRGHPLPDPVLLSAGDLAAPIERPGEACEWCVDDHDAEPYEAMRVMVRDVTVTAMNLGKAQDNYNLHSSTGDDCWAADYMNADVQPSGYHAYVGMGRHFCAVSGTLEQYTQTGDGWDYDQIVTMSTADLAICDDGDHDGDVDLDDLPRFRACITGAACHDVTVACHPPAWTRPPIGLTLEGCVMMDLDFDGDVDLRDFAGLQATFGETAR